MRKRHSAGALISAAAVSLQLAAGAVAAPVIMLGPGAHARVVEDPFVVGPAVTPRATGPGAPVARPARARRRHRPRHKPGRTVVSELARLERIGAITAAQHDTYLADFKAALRSERRLRGTRQVELESVIENLHVMAVRRLITPSRLPALFLTLDRNRQWWTGGPLLSYGDRVEFAGSQLVWEYYPGQGVELQELASFGKADGLYAAGPADYPQLQELLAELIPLAAQRAGGLGWEYYFNFDGGSPPWVSGMAQGTALEALTRAYHAFGDATYLQIAHQALPLLSAAPPRGVQLLTPQGSWYLQYSFAPGATVLNGFLQTLIGIYDYANATGDPAAQQLWAAGDAAAQVQVPSYDTGAWSLYQPGQEDSLSYHELVTGFLDQLCSLTHTAIYCTTASHFHAYLKTAPVLTQLTTRARAGRAFELAFRLSKESHVGVVIGGAHPALATSAGFRYGTNSFWVPAIKHPGTYPVKLAATDLAGNFARIVGTLTVTPAHKKRHKGP